MGPRWFTNTLRVVPRDLDATAEIGLDIADAVDAMRAETAGRGVHLAAEPVERR